MNRAACLLRPSFLTLAAMLAACCLPAVRAARGQSESTGPETRPAFTRLSERYRELDLLATRTPAEAAEYVGLHFALSVAVGDSVTAARDVDEIGYQTLPLAGELPLDPPRPLRSGDLTPIIAALPDANLHDLPGGAFRMLDRAALRATFPAVATWMLPGDYALVFDLPPPDVRNWVRRPACIVLRPRGRLAEVIGGNLLEALTWRPPAAAEPAGAPASETP